MDERVVRVCAHHVLTPLADGSAENFRCVSEGKSAVRSHDWEAWGLAEDFMAGIIAEPVEQPRAYTMALHSCRTAIEQYSHPLPLDRTLLVVSTTKGNIELLTPTATDDSIRLGHFAQQIADELGFTLPPICVSNACTSGVCAVVDAWRALKTGMCDVAIVCGVEAQSRFIVSGFQSFHALSPELCRPFSSNRVGLNVGEAAATIILEAVAAEDIRPDDWMICAGAIRNDANHISGPSRTGEGSYRVLDAVMRDARADDLAFVSVHGTATPYNDEMESIAIERAGLLAIPICSLKGYYGHTMGAAGVLETIISMQAVEAGIVPATLGYDNQLGTTREVSVSADKRPTTKNSFVKLISGFGGVNAAVRMEKGKEHVAASPISSASPVASSFTVHITPTGATLNGQQLPTSLAGDELITELYRLSKAAYPKYFKMDPLCRLGFVASELLLASLDEQRFVARDDRAVILASRSGCMATDVNYERTIVPGDNYFPSPAVFVYTLPNIVTGEIAIRNKYLGETSMYLIDATDAQQRQRQLHDIQQLAFADPATQSLLTGWVDYEDATHFEASLTIVNR